VASIDDEDDLFVQMIATIAITHKTFGLDKPGWIAALVAAHKRKEKYWPFAFYLKNDW